MPDPEEEITRKMKSVLDDSLQVQICKALGLDPNAVLEIDIEVRFNGVTVFVKAKDPPGLADIEDWYEAKIDIERKPTLNEA